jgi:hypothetical protein
MHRGIQSVECDFRDVDYGRDGTVNDEAGTPLGKAFALNMSKL